MSCATAPPPSCANATTVRTYAAPGTCTGGTCTFANYTDTPCAGGSCSGGTCVACSPTLVSAFSADFSSPSSTSWTTGSGALLGGGPWSVYTSSYYAVRYSGGRLEITNQPSTSTGHGQGFAYVKAGGAGAHYDTGVYDSTLAANAGEEVVWSFNMRRDDPDTTSGGFSCSSSSSQNYGTVGLAWILAMDLPNGAAASASTCSPSATGKGYAVVLGGSSGAVRLVRFESGLRNGTLTNIVASGSNTVTRYFSVRVTYNAVTHQWRLESRSDGTSSFSDPATGTYSFTGTGNDSTWVNLPLDYAGPYLQGGCTGLCDSVTTARFDNFSVGVRCAQ